jgi:RimJ/RimL family protein N-acetyltransferase
MSDWNGIELEGLVLHSGRLTLRPWQASDVAAVRQIMADDRMGQYLRQASQAAPDSSNTDVAHRIVSEIGQQGRASGSRLDCAIAENTTGDLVGGIALLLPTSPQTAAELGYWLGTGFQGRGYVSEAVQTLSRFGFGQGLGRIRIVCEVANRGSAAVALRTGYAFEGISRGDRATSAGPVDAAVFGRTAADPGEPIKPAWNSMTELTDGVVTLRPQVASDWPTVLAEGSNAESIGWGFGGDPMDEADAIARAAKAPLDWLVGRQAQLLICDAATGGGAGTLTMRAVGPPGVVAIGYGVLPEFRGRRFTSRALRLLTDWAFEHTEINRFELGCKADNLASARSAEAAGFVADGRFAGRLRNPDGSFSDEIGYGKVRPR